MNHEKFGYSDYIQIFSKET